MSERDEVNRRVVSDQGVPVFAADAARWGADPKLMLPSLPGRVVTVSTPQIWVETSFADVWTAAYRFAVRDGALVVAELRLFPGGLERDVRREPPGLWRGEIQGVDAVDVPTGGITSRLLKRLQIGTHHREHAKLSQDLVAKGGRDRWHPGNLAERMGVKPSASSGPRRGRKPSISIEFLAKVAKTYHEAVERGERPVAAIARRLRIPKERVPGYVYAARNTHFLLTATGPGQTSGVLTPKARAILAKEENGGRKSSKRRSGRQRATKPPRRKR